MACGNQLMCNTLTKQYVHWMVLCDSSELEKSFYYDSLGLGGSSGFVHLCHIASHLQIHASLEQRILVAANKMRKTRLVTPELWKAISAYSWDCGRRHISGILERFEFCLLCQRPWSSLIQKSVILVALIGWLGY